jgi:integrase
MRSIRMAGSWSEEGRLLAAGGPRLQNLIIAAAETCARRGELLSLQWRDVNLQRGELTIRAAKAKDSDTRVLPISARLEAVLKMAKTDPAGEDYKATSTFLARSASRWTTSSAVGKRVR